MAFDGNGNWIPEFSAKEDRDAGVKILASRFDDVFQQDLKDSFERCLTNDGQSRPLQDFNFNNHRGINVADPEVENDVVNKRILDKSISELDTDIDKRKANINGDNITEEMSSAVLEKANKETVSSFVGLGMPDYNSVTTVSSGYTAPKNGFFLCTFPVRAEGSLKIGSFSIVFGYNYNYTQPSFCCYPVKKGDVITFSGCEVKFVPAVGG